MKETIGELRKDLNIWRTRLRHGGGKEYMNQTCRDAINWCDAAIKGVRRSAENAGAEFSRMSDRWGTGLLENEEPKVLHYPTLASRAANVGGWFALMLEGVIAGSMAVWLFELPAIWAFALGVCVCVATSVFIKGICAPVLLARADAHPKQAAHWLLVALFVLAPVEFGLLTVAFLVRGATGDFADSIGWAFPVVIGVLSVSTPILAALLFTAAGLFGWSRHLTAQYEEARHLEREILSLKATCERQLADQTLKNNTQGAPTVAIWLKPNEVEGGQAVAGELQLVNEAPDVGAEVVLTCDHKAVQIPFSVSVAPRSKFVSFTGMTTPVSDPVIAVISARMGTSITAAKLTISPRNGNRIGFGIPAIALALLLAPSQGHGQQLGRIWVDRTSSCVQEDLRRALEESGAQLPEISANRGVRNWEYYRFADDAWTTKPYYSFAIPAGAQSACQVPVFSEAEKAFKAFHEARVRKAAAECARRNEGELERRTQAMAKVFSEARAQLAPVSTGGRCTALRDLFTRIAYDTAPAVNYVISDGLESCAKSFTEIPKPRSGSSAYLILVGTKTGNVGSLAEEFFRRASILNAFLPWVRVVPFWALKATELDGQSAPPAAHFIQAAASPQ